MTDSQIRRTLRRRLGPIQTADLDDLTQDVHTQLLASPTMTPMQAITRATWYFRHGSYRYGRPMTPDDVALACDLHVYPA